MQVMLRGTQMNYMPDKSHLIIITINTPGQIVVQDQILTRKTLIFHFERKSPTQTELQSEQVQIHANYGNEMVSSGILGFSLAMQSCLTSLQPIRIRVANAFAALAFLIWPARRCVLQRAVCHLATRTDNHRP